MRAMQDDHRWLQLIGSAFILLLGALLLAVRQVRRLHPAWREALGLIAVYLAVGVIVRLLAMEEILTQADARIVNGLIAAAFASALLVDLIGLWVARVDS